MEKENLKRILGREVVELAEELQHLPISTPLLKPRIKSPESILKKGQKEVYDLLGIQICTLHNADIAKVCAFVERHFNVVKAISYDKTHQPAKRMKVDSPSRYYNAKHFIVRVEEGVLLELQINTVFQRIIADYFHYYIFYKPKRKFEEQELKLVDFLSGRLEKVEREVKDLIEKLFN